MSDILTSDGTIDSSKIDISNFNIGDLSGSLSSTVITNSGLATTAEVTNKISTLNNTIASDYIPKSNNFWKQLNSNIVINATTAPYSIDIAVDAQRTSYLHLTGEQINFVVNNTEGALIVQPDGIKTEYIRTRYIHMGRDIGTPTLGWVLRDNQHLSLKVL